MTAKLSNPAASPNPRRQWYGTQIWKMKRAHQLRAKPLCAICKAEGRITGATIADHDPPHLGDYNAFVMGPLRSLCAACHDALQGFKHKGYSREIGLDGYPIDERHPFYRVRG
jgi:5-methylcytosine-specific restriction enzyme A